MKKTFAFILTTAAFAVTTQAGMVSYSDTIPLQSTNWGTFTLSVPQFDASFGTLTSVTVEFGGDVLGEANAESLDASPSTVTLDVSAEIEFTGPISSVVIPLISQSVNLTSFDTLIDFAGTSGYASGLVSGSDSDSVTDNSPDFGVWVGGGSVDFDAIARGASVGSGAGNLITQFATSAAADVTVIYEYEATNHVPDNATSLSLFGIGCVVLGAIRQRRALA